MKRKLLLFFIIIHSLLNAQCDKKFVKEICKIENITDGLVNLYDLYENDTGTTINRGNWEEVQVFNYSLLDKADGIVNVWNLFYATHNSTGVYEYKLFNGDCTNEALTVTIKLGAFSGIKNISSDGINLRVCYDKEQQFCGKEIEFDLRAALSSNPNAHKGGAWSYLGKEGLGGNFISLTGNFFSAKVPYVPGGNLTEQEVFKFKYTVNSSVSCNPSSSTDVRIAVIRSISAGFGSKIFLCEDNINNGIYAQDINLKDDIYLRNEDQEGYWEDESKPGIKTSESIINLKDLYRQRLPVNQRFEKVELKYKYKVEDRANFCGDDSSEVTFIILEKIRPFKPKKKLLEFCCDKKLGKIDLYSNLKFTTENGILYDYDKKDKGSFWTIIPNFSEELRTQFLSKNSDWYFDVTKNILLSNNPKTLVDLSFISNEDAKKYTFKYVVPPSYNSDSVLDPSLISSGVCEDKINISTCNTQSATFEVDIKPSFYLGEDTNGIVFCESMSTIDLISLLNVKDDKKITTKGIWVDTNTGIEVTNPFTPKLTQNVNEFNLKHTLTLDYKCFEEAILSFTIYKELSAGQEINIELCKSDKTVINLFEKLTDVPTTGVWEYPNGKTTNHNLMIKGESAEPGTYIYKVPPTKDLSGKEICSGNESTISLKINDVPNAGEDITTEVCTNNGVVDLFSLLKGNNTNRGHFYDSNNNKVDLNFDPSVFLGEKVFTYKTDVGGCEKDESKITLTFIEPIVPVAKDQLFCAVKKTPKIGDLEVSGSTNYQWYESIDSNIELSLETILKDNSMYYVTTSDSNGCASKRVKIKVSFMPIGGKDCPLCVADGLSDNNDGVNDYFELCNLPELYPDYNLDIYNRYGVLVFKGNKSTGLFSGKSNVIKSNSSLATGVYYYIFNPNDGKTKPIQKDFYLGR